MNEVFGDLLSRLDSEWRQKEMHVRSNAQIQATLRSQRGPIKSLRDMIPLRLTTRFLSGDRKAGGVSTCMACPASISGVASSINPPESSTCACVVLRREPVNLR